MAASDKNLRSPVWQYFFSVFSTPDGKKKAKCNMCKVEVSYSGGSTRTMSNHLKHVNKSLKTEVNDGKPKILQKPTLTCLVLFALGHFDIDPKHLAIFD